ncbi:MAG: hypothetical protein E7660_03945 [Ruminococcaceae bacterium]|nr:hypothetical protein [Oscillospiraceae bacterium]
MLKTIKRMAALLTVLAILLAMMPSVFSVPVGAYDYIAYGIDVSKWQKTIDWDAVKSTGVDFVILKVGSTKGMDEYFEFNYLGAKSRGLNVGAYYYTYAMSEAEAAAEAETLVSWIKGKTFEYPIYFDIEDPSQEVLSKQTRTNMCIAFNTVLENNGYFAGIYSSKSWLNSSLDRATLSAKYAIWEASWRNSGQADIDKSADCQMWQYSATGSVSGISGNVDMDVSYVNYPEIIKRVGLNGFAKGSVASTVRAYYTTTASSLNVRSDPSTDHGVVTSVSQGTTVLVLDANSAGTWVKVKIGSTVGWLSAKYLTLSTPVPVEYTVSYDMGISGISAPQSVKLAYGGVTAASNVSAPSGYAFKGWNVKRASDGLWYTGNGWSQGGKALIGAGTKIALDEKFVSVEAGNDTYMLTAVWESVTTYGDVNGDGDVNAKDLMSVRKYLVGEATLNNIGAADVDGNGTVALKDVLYLKMYQKGLISSFPAEEK